MHINRLQFVCSAQAMWTAIALAASLGLGHAAPRAIPLTLPHHPGNIFLAGQDVSVTLPSAPSGGWQLLDYDDKVLAEPAVQDGKANLGPLPVGFYRLIPKGNPTAPWISLGVIAPLKAPTPKSSPVALDVAMAWFYGKAEMDAAASLCALAGVNWVRDRLNWAQMEPQRGQFSGENIYDASARAQSRAGLQVLQVHHASPGWANPNRKRFPLDLRDTYRFHREMARRWQGQVLAFEPWNEADIAMFGGHTGAEMAAQQKAAYLGLKAGNPDAIACLNVFAMHRQAQLEDLRDNAAWPYFDTFNLHHYEGFERYPELYAAFRAVSAGKPLWVTECARPVKWAGDDKLKEPTDADLRVQAERVAKTFALSVHEGSVATFYFLLPHYVEGQTQFGILRPDMTPRPAFVALAAVGRLMADAKPLGKIKSDTTQQAYLFQVQADGQKRRLAIAWDETAASEFEWPAETEAVFDHLGREQKPSRTLRLSSAPRFVLLSGKAVELLTLAPPPAPPARLCSNASPVVLQALWPEDKVAIETSAYRIAVDRPETIPVWICNFSEQPVQGTLSVQAPTGWKVTLPESVALEPDERKELPLALNISAADSPPTGTVQITGHFGPANRPVLSLRLVGTK